MTNQVSYRSLLTIQAPRSTDWQPEGVQQIIATWLNGQVPVTLIIRATHQHITWQIEVAQTAKQTVINSLHTIYPQVEIIDTNKTTADIGYYLYQFDSVTPFVGSLNYAKDFKVDPLAHIAGAMMSLTAGEALVYELAVRPPTQAYSRHGDKLLKISAVHWSNYLSLGGAKGALGAQLTGADKVERYNAEVNKLARGKLLMLLNDAELNVKIKAATAQRAHAILQTFAASLSVFTRPGMAALYTATQYKTFPLVLCAPEIAALWHLPTQDITAPWVDWSHGTKAPAPVSVHYTKTTWPKDAVLVGVNEYQGNRNGILIKDPDRRLHVNLVGGTGVGKSTMMLNMIKQDIRHGKGVAVIDPNGDLVKDVMTRCLDEKDIDRVILFDVNDVGYPIGLNLLAQPKNLEINEVASETLSIIKKLFADQWSQGRMEDVMYSSLAALVTAGNTTVRDIPRLLLNEHYRREVLSKLTDFNALEYWHEDYAHRSEGDRVQIAGPINTRIRQFYRNPKIRRIFCQQASLDFREIIDSGKIVLANLSGLPDIERDVLGALLISKFQTAFMSRTDMEREDRAPYYVYIDEVQNFVTTSLDKMLSEARKYGLNLVIANQYLYQLGTDVLKSVMGNVGTTIIFKIGEDDAKTLSAYVRPTFNGDDLLHQDPHNTVVRMIADGKSAPVFSMVTLPSPEPTEDAETMITRIRDQTRARYARTAAEVDAELSIQPVGEPTNDHPKDESYYG